MPVLINDIYYFVDLSEEFCYNIHIKRELKSVMIKICIFLPEGV